MNTAEAEAKRNTSPSLLLKLKTTILFNGLFIFFILFNLCLLFNIIIPQSSVYALLTYIMIRIIFPGGSWGCEHGDGSPWRAFSERYFTPGSIMRSYLELGFGPLPKAFVQQEAMPDAQFILAAFPHGCGSEFRILIEGVLQNVMPNIIAKNNLRTLAASVLFHIPIVREISLWTGCINASRKTAEKALDRGRSLIVLPGGEAEQIMTTYGEEKVYLSKRKGFIKLAMRKKVSVVPMYVFGCSDYFYTSTMMYSLRYKLMKNLGVCIPLCAGLFGSTVCPLAKKTTIVFGEPLEFEMKGADPTDEELDAAHALFTKELIALFDKHKVALGYGDRKLQIT